MSNKVNFKGAFPQCRQTVIDEPVAADAMTAAAQSPAEHTPVPWSYELYADGHYFVSEAKRVGSVRALVDPKEPANAAFIVKAVNSHGALVKALTIARAAIASLPMEALGYASADNDQAHWPIRDELLHNIDEALATPARTATERM